MKRSIILLIILTALVATAAQAETYYNREHGLAVEVFGTGGELSLNYENIIATKYVVRVGAGMTGVAFRKGYAVPFGVSTLLGKDQTFLELGVGGSWVDFDADETDDTYLDVMESQLVGTGTIGYRYMGDNGFTFRLAFTPALTKDGFQPMGGAMFGRSW